jgi:hypothetical protein
MRTAFVLQKADLSMIALNDAPAYVDRKSGNKAD